MIRWFVAIAALCLSQGVAAATAYRMYIDGPWGQIHARVDGDVDGAPTVVLIHQMVWSSVQFRNVQPLLARQGVRSIAVDIPGYGQSDGPKAVPTAADYAEFLLPVLDRFGIERAILHGNHTGATLIAAFADAHPNRVDRLIIQGPPLFDAATRQKLIDEKPFDQTPRADGGHLIDRWRQGSTGFGAKTSVASQHEGLIQFFSAGPNEWYAHDAVYRFDLKPVLQRIKTPALILTNPGDSLHQASLELKAMRPDFEVVMTDWTGAHAIYDDPGPWADAVAAYVRKSKPRRAEKTGAAGVD